MISIRIFLIFALSLCTLSAEIDPYTYVDSYKSSGFNEINRDVNMWLDTAIDTLNDEQIECPTNVDDADELYDIVQESISSPFIGHSIAVHFHDTLPSDKITKTEMYSSIYNTISWYEGFSLNLKGLLGVTVDHSRKIGVDKMGHFFVEGWGFYKRAYLRGEVNIENAIRWGKFTERTYFGMTTTGVYSNADLVANFNGMRFWNHLLLLNEDPIESKTRRFFKKPLFSCKDSKWKKNSRFNFHYYLDNAWDEERNCNYYDTENIKEEVKAQAAMKLGYKELKKRDGVICPIRKRGCSREIFKYGKYAKDLLHESCFDESASYRVDPEKYFPDSIYSRISEIQFPLLFPDIDARLLNSLELNQ